MKRVAIVGLGLIGGSVARALRAADSAIAIVAVGRDTERLAIARAHGLVDDTTDRIEDAVSAADLVIIATPLAAMAGLLAKARPAVGSQTVVTDVGSAKVAVVAIARATLGERFPRFVPGHPIAGAEASGFEASRADLFQGRRTVLTPVSETAPDALAQTESLWRLLGAEVCRETPDRHDRILALTSHLPHLLAFTVVHQLMDAERVWPDLFGFAGSGFADFSRIAASDPVMWRDIVNDNREAILAALAGHVASIEGLRTRISRGDGAELLSWLSEVSRRRRALGTRAGVGEDGPP